MKSISEIIFQNYYLGTISLHEYIYIKKVFMGSITSIFARKRVQEIVISEHSVSLSLSQWNSCRGLWIIKSQIVQNRIIS